MIDNTLRHLQPATLAHLAAEILLNHADVDETRITFHTEDAQAAYYAIGYTGEALTNAATFNDLIELAYDKLAQ
jgi:hypothetical protein